MSSPRISKHYKRYQPGEKDISRKMREGKACDRCGSKDQLTTAHLDQNPDNNAPENRAVLCRSYHIKHDQPFHVMSMMTAKKTDNSHAKEKAKLRIESIKNIKGKIRILEAFAGGGVIWDSVIKQTGRDIEILKIEMKDGKKGIYLKGDNMKFISLFEFGKYNILDFDAYGSPFHQLEVVFKKSYKGIVHCTFIQSQFGRLNEKMLEKIGYSKTMIKKIPSLFNKNGWNKFKQYLAQNGVKKIRHITKKDKHYLWFRLE